MNCLRIERKRLDVEYRRQYFRSIWNSNIFVKIFFARLIFGVQAVQKFRSETSQDPKTRFANVHRNSSRLSNQQAFRHRTICKKDFMTMGIKDLLKGPTMRTGKLQMIIEDVVYCLRRKCYTTIFAILWVLQHLVPASLCLSLLCNPFRKKRPKNRFPWKTSRKVCDASSQ